MIVDNTIDGVRVILSPDEATRWAVALIRDGLESDGVALDACAVCARAGARAKIPTPSPAPAGLRVWMAQKEDKLYPVAMVLAPDLGEARAAAAQVGANPDTVQEVSAAAVVPAEHVGFYCPQPMHMALLKLEAGG